MLTPKIKDNNWTSVRQAISKLYTKLGPNSEPTFNGITLTGLTATRLVQSDSSKALASVATLSSWIAGTANQVVIADDGDGTVTLSLPQDIHTGASPTFAGMTIVNAINEFSKDGTMSGDSDSAVPTEKATKLYTDTLRSDLASTANAKGASLVGVEDAATQFDATDVEAALVELMVLVTPVEYNPTMSRTAGGDAGGNDDSVATIDDADSYDTDELAATPGFDIQAVFSGVTDFNQVQIHTAYDGNPAHVVRIDLDKTPFNWSSFDTILADIDDNSGNFIFNAITVASAGQYINSGEVRLRFYHSSAGNATHDFFIDYCALWKTGASVGVTEHGGLTGLLDESDHPQYVLHSLADATNDFLVASGDDVFIKKTLAETGALLEGDIVHDNLQSVPVNDHIDHTGVTLTAGTGLTGGGDISANRSFAVDGVLEDLDTLGAAGSDGQFIVATGAGVFAYEATTVVRTSLGLGTGDSPTFTGLTLSGITLGSVLFTGASGVISQDNSNLFWDNANNRLGIGTASPDTMLHIIDDSFPIATFERTTSAIDVIRSGYRLLITTSGDMANGFGGGVVFSVEDDTSGVINSGRIVTVRSGDNDSTHDFYFSLNSTLDVKMAIKSAGNVGIGTIDPKTLLTVEGTVTLKEQAAADGDTAAYGQIWVKNDDPTTLWFTDDLGTDVQLAVTLAHTHDTDTLQLDGINSNGGAFSFTTSGAITFTQNLIIPDGGTVGQAAGPLITFDDSNNYLEITGCTVGIGTSSPVAALTIKGTLPGAGNPDAAINIGMFGSSGIIQAPNGGPLSIWDASSNRIFQFNTDETMTSYNNLYLYHAGNSDADNSGERPLTWQSDDSGNNQHDRANIGGMHDGTGTDSKGKLKFRTNNGTSLTVAMTIDSSQKVGIGTTDPKTLLTVEGTVTLKEQAAADGDTAAYGQIWVKNDDPTTLWFTDDTGVDHQLAYA